MTIDEMFELIMDAYRQGYLDAADALVKLTPDIEKMRVTLKKVLEKRSVKMQ